MSLEIACMLCGAAGGRELFLSVLAIFALMFLGTIALLASSIVGGDFADVATRARPLEAEAETSHGEADRG